VEINRRVTPALHKGAAFGVDLAAALHAALDGQPATAARTDLDEGEEYVTVNFPQEWLRDPKSDWMRNYPVDAPWDDPDLFLAMLALRHGDTPVQGASGATSVGRVPPGRGVASGHRPGAGGDIPDE
jgi:hypothetical protein